MTETLTDYMDPERIRLRARKGSLPTTAERQALLDHIDRREEIIVELRDRCDLLTRQLQRFIDEEAFQEKAARDVPRSFDGSRS